MQVTVAVAGGHLPAASGSRADAVHRGGNTGNTEGVIPEEGPGNPGMVNAEAGKKARKQVWRVSGSSDSDKVALPRMMKPALSRIGRPVVMTGSALQGLHW